MGLVVTIRNLLVGIFFTILLSSCGKSGGEQQKQADSRIPTVTLPDDMRVKEHDNGQSSLIKISGSVVNPSLQALSYHWSVDKSDVLNLTDPKSAELEFYAPDVKQDTELVLTLTVTDTAGLSASDSIRVIIEKVNNPPVFEASTRVRIAELQNFSLEAKVSDPDDDALTLEWSIADDPAALVKLNNNNSLTLEAEVASVTHNSLVTLKAVADDGDGGVSEALYELEILDDDQAPSGVTLISGTANSTSQIVLDWLEASDNVSAANELTYRLHLNRGERFIPSEQTVYAQVTDHLTLAVDGLEKGTDYYAQLEVMDKSGNKAFSNQIKVSTLQKEPVLNPNQPRYQLNNFSRVGAELVMSVDANNPAPKVGDLLVNAEGSGLLRLVSQVAVDGPLAKITTSPASINRAYQELALATQVKLMPLNDAQSESRKAELQARGVELRQSRSVGSELHWPMSALTVSQASRQQEVNSRHQDKIATKALSRVATNETASSSALQQEKRDTNLVITGPKYVLFRPEQQNQLTISANIIDDDSNSLEIGEFELVSLTHGTLTVPSDLELHTTDTRFVDGTRRFDKTLFWTPALSQVDFEHNEPYVAKFRASIARPNEPDDVVLFTTKIYVGSELPTKSIARIEDDNAGDGLDLTLDSEFYFAPDINISADIANGVLSSARAELSGFVDIDAEFRLSATGAGSATGRQTLIDRQFVKISANSEVPVVVHGRFTLEAQISGQVDNELDLTHVIASGLVLDAGFEYQNGQWSAIGSVTPSLSYGLNGRGQGEAYGEIKFIPTFTMGFYETASAEVEIAPKLYTQSAMEGELDTTRAHRNSASTQDTRLKSLQVGAEAMVGVAADLSSLDASVLPWPSADLARKQTKEALANVLLAGAPELSLATGSVEIGSNSCQLTLVAGVAPVAMTTSNETLFDWLAETTSWNGFTPESQTHRQTELAHEFQASAKFDAASLYRIRFTGNSELGSWSRQYQELTLDLTDANDDGLPDHWATRFALSSGQADSDGDGLSNSDEFAACTLPNDTDSDNDGMSDGDEVNFGLDPHTDDAQQDLDGDGRSNIVELQQGTPVGVANLPPVVNIQVVEFDEVASRLVLRANASDVDGVITEYLWQETSGHGLVLSSQDQAQIDIALPYVESETLFSFNVRVMDNEGSSATSDSDVSVTVIERVNTPPTVAVAAPSVVNAGDTVNLDGSASSDLEDSNSTQVQPLQFAWQQTDSTAVSLALSGSDSAIASFVAPSVREATEFQFALTVSDSEGLSSTETVSLRVEPLPSDITKGLLVHLPLEADLNDSSEQENHAAGQGNLEHVLASVRTGLRVSTADSQVLLPEDLTEATQETALAFWYRGEHDAGTQTLVSKAGDYRVQLTDGNEVAIEFWQDSEFTEVHRLPLPEALESQQNWHLFVINLNNQTQQGEVYVDGASVGVFGWPTPLPSLDSGSGLTLAATATANSPQSYDELRVYDRVLTTDEVALLYRQRTNFANRTWVSRYADSTQVITDVGVQITGSGVREAGHTCSEQTLDLSELQWQFSWQIGDDALAVYGLHLLNNAGDWSQPVLSLGSFSSDHAFEGSDLVQTGQTYYTQVQLQGAEALVTTRLNGFGSDSEDANENDNLVQQKLLDLADIDADKTQLTFCFGLWDNYAGLDASVTITDAQFAAPSAWPSEPEPDTPAIELAELVGRILVIRGTNDSQDWLWAINLVHESNGSTETVSYFGQRSRTGDGAFSWQQQVASWELEGINLTLSREGNEYPLVFEDGQINVGEDLSDVMGDEATIGDFYLPTTVATTGVAGHKFVFMDAPNNLIYDFVDASNVLIYQEGSSEQQTLNWSVAEGDTELRFTYGDGQSFGFGNYDEFSSFMQVYGSNLAAGKLLLHIVGNPIVDDVFAELELQDEKFAACIRRLAQYYNWEGFDQVDKINCSTANITSAQGIELFPQLRELNLSHNRLTSIDLSQNTELRVLNLADNQLTTINLDNNRQLHTATLVNNPFDEATIEYLLSIDWIANLLFGTDVGAPVITSRLNDTGITTCSNVDTNGLSCPVTGFRGQDGEYGRDDYASDELLEKVGAGRAGFDFTKIDANGNELPANALVWNCVRDNVTGLIWEVKSTDGGIRDAGNTYTWFNSTGINDGGLAGTENGGACTDTDKCDTEKFVQSVNTEGLCGASDWRLPEKEELRSLVDYGSFLPAIDTDYFPNTQPAIYWSVTPVSSNYILAWNAYFNYGDVYYAYKSGASFVRLVRGGN